MGYRTFLQTYAPLLLLIVSIVAYALYFSTLTILRFDAFEARSLDLGNFDQAIWNTAHGRWFHLTNQDGVVNRLSLHVEPILIPISLLYHIYSSPKTLFVLQSTVVALGAIPVFALAKLRLCNRWLALIFALSFLLNPSIQAANWLEFHAVTLAPTFLLAAFYFLHVRRVGWFALFAILAASCKEEIGLLVFMLGLYIFLKDLRITPRTDESGQHFLKGINWPRQRWGILTMIGSFAWAFLAVFVIQNLFATGNIHWGRYGYLGDSPVQMVRTILTQPAVVWDQLQSAQAGLYGLKMLIPVGLLGLLAPEILFLALPSLGINLLADFAPMHQVDTLIYAVPIVPFVTVAGIMGAGRLLDWFTPTRTSPERDRRTKVLCIIIGTIVLICSLGNQYLYGYLPGAGNDLPLTVTEHHRNAAAIIAQIEPDAKVSAQDRLNPHVSQRETVYIFPRVDDADTVFLDIAGPAWPQHPSDLKRSIMDLFEQGFGVAAAADGYLLLKRDHANKALPSDFYRAWLGETAVDSPLSIDFAETLRLLNARVETDRYGELVVTLDWQLLQPTEQDIGFYIAYVDRDWHELHSTQFYPPTAALWYPTSLWKSVSASDDGNNIEAGFVQTQIVQTLPWTLAEDRFTLMLGLYDQGEGGDANWQSSARLPVTALSPALPLLENGTLVRLGGYERNASKRGNESGEWRVLPIAHQVPAEAKDARFGTNIVLDGISVQNRSYVPSELLDFRLHWQLDSAETDPAVNYTAFDYTSVDYTAFVHLIDANGRTVAQLDWQPHDAIGRLPTSAWIEGQPVLDNQQLALPDELADGLYQLIVGLYDWRDGTRLPVTGADGLPGDVVEVTQIEMRNE